MKQGAPKSNWLGPFIENISNGSGTNGGIVGSARKVILQKYYQNTANKGVPGTDNSVAGSPSQNNRG